MLSFPHASVLLGLLEAEHITYIYIDYERKFFGNRCRVHSRCLVLGQVQGLLMIQEFPRYEISGPVFQLPTAEFCR